MTDTGKRLGVWQFVFGPLIGVSLMLSGGFLLVALLLSAIALGIPFVGGTRATAGKPGHRRLPTSVTATQTPTLLVAKPEYQDLPSVPFGYG